VPPHRERRPTLLAPNSSRPEHKTSSQASRCSLGRGMAVVDIPATVEEVQERIPRPDPGSPDRNSLGPADPDIAAAGTGPAALAEAALAEAAAAGSERGKWEPGQLPGPHSR
jgi:hypothetical protein